MDKKEVNKFFSDNKGYWDKLAKLHLKQTMIHVERSQKSCKLWDKFLNKIVLGRVV